MNIYYHEFRMDFLQDPFVMLTVVLAFAATVAGFLSVKITARRPRNVVNQKIATAIIAVLSAIWGKVFWHDTFDGMLQTFDNNASTYDSPIWALIGATYAEVIVIVVFFFTIKGLYSVAVNLQISRLSKQLGRTFTDFADEVDMLQEEIDYTVDTYEAELEACNDALYGASVLVLAQQYAYDVERGQVKDHYEYNGIQLVFHEPSTQAQTAETEDSPNVIPFRKTI